MGVTERFERSPCSKCRYLEAFVAPDWVKCTKLKEKGIIFAVIREECEHFQEVDTWMSGMPRKRVMDTRE